MKYVSLPSLLRLVDLINVCCKFVHTPEEKRLATVISIIKEGNRFDCNNYRSGKLAQYVIYNLYKYISATSIK
jgi:hypothetical protein